MKTICGEAEESYIAGLIAGDGHLEPRTHRTVISTNDECLRESTNKILFELGFSPKNIFDKVGGNVWKISVYSEKFQATLVEKYGLKKGNKTVSMKPPSECAFEEAYIGGLYDAEGWLEFLHAKYWRVRFKIKNLPVASWVHKKLVERGFHATLRPKDSCWIVDINRQQEVKMFVNSFPLFHSKWRNSGLLASLTAEGLNFQGHTWHTMAETMRSDAER